MSGGARSLGVSSTFLVVPQLEGGGAPVLYVDDDIPADRLASPRLYQHLSKLWGRSTVLALALSEFDRAKGKGDRPGDKDALKRIAKYLQRSEPTRAPGTKHWHPRSKACSTRSERSSPSERLDVRAGAPPRARAHALGFAGDIVRFETGPRAQTNVVLANVPVKALVTEYLDPGDTGWAVGRLSRVA